MSASAWGKHPEELFELAVRRDRKGRVRVSASLQRDIYAAIDLDAGRTGVASLSQQAIAECIGDGVTRQTVNEGIAGLAEVDLISIERTGRSLRYYVHHRGVRAPIQMRHPLEDDPTCRDTPTPQAADLSGHPDRLQAPTDPDMSGHPDRSRQLMSGHPDRSASRTSFRKEEEEVNQIPRPSSSFDPDPDTREIETALCGEHGIEGLASRTTDGQFYHRRPDGSWHTFVPERSLAAASADPYSRVYRRN